VHRLASTLLVLLLLPACQGGAVTQCETPSLADHNGQLLGQSAECPASAPTEGASCGDTCVRCVYGALPSCRSLLQCNDDGIWHALVRASPCPMIDDCPSSSDPNTTTTPLTCSVLGELCVYPPGRALLCEKACSPVASTASFVLIDQPDRRCPAGPPSGGAACAVEGLQCSFHECNAQSIFVYVNATCSGGAWDVQRLTGGLE
jgi:hypothetical protein